MRYYDIQILNPFTGSQQVDNSTYEPLRWRSLNDKGINLPGALNVEIDAQIYPFALPAAASLVRIWGLPLKTLGQSTDLNGLRIAVKAGMSKGLPLANPEQAGLLFEGYIQQSFGFWQDTSQHLDLICQGGEGPVIGPKKIPVQWKKGFPLADMIRLAIETAFDGYTADIAISPNLVLAQDEPGYYRNIVQFAQFVWAVSKHIIKSDDYPGVNIILHDKIFTVYDGSTKKTPKQIAFNDLVGQPTWLKLSTINVRTVMRADINVGDYIKLPPGQVTTTAASSSQYRNTSAQQGVFQVKYVRHTGNFRQPDGDSWVTSIDAVNTKAATI